MKDKSKPSGKVDLVDAKPISIPMISSTSGNSKTSPPPKISLAAVAAAVSEVKSISRSQVAVRPGMISRGTQTGADNMPEDLQEKRRLIRKQLAVLLHAVLCRVRDELIGNTGQGAREVRKRGVIHSIQAPRLRRQCPTAFCGLMKNVLNHMRTCTARTDCTEPHCLSSRQILSHWKTCTQADCPVCSSLRRVVPAYLDAVVSNPRWRDEIITRFDWLITFIRPINMRTTTPALRLPHLEQRQAEMDEAEQRSHTNDAEE